MGSMFALRASMEIAPRIRIASAIRTVPRGMVSTYGAVAKAAGLTRGARQVAGALRGDFGLPWHRIVGAGGEIKLRGYAAFEQRMRLESEGVIFRGKRVNMVRHEFQFPQTTSELRPTRRLRTKYATKL